MTELQKGYVKWFNDQKGYGVIESEAGQSVFVHYTAIKNSEQHRTLLKNSLVQFKVMQGIKGAQAEEVMVIHIYHE